MANQLLEHGHTSPFKALLGFLWNHGLTCTYSQTIKAGDLVFTSGQLPIDPATCSFPEGGIKEQTRQSLLNVKAILEEAGLTMNNVIKSTLFLADMNDYDDMNSVYHNSSVSHTLRVPLLRLRHCLRARCGNWDHRVGGVVSNRGITVI